MAVRAATSCDDQSLPYIVIRAPTITIQVRHPTAPEINKGRLPTLSRRMMAGRVANTLQQIRRRLCGLGGALTYVNNSIDTSGKQGGGVWVETELPKNCG